MSDCGCGGKSTQRLPWQGDSFKNVAQGAKKLSVTVSKNKKSTKVSIKRK